LEPDLRAEYEEIEQRRTEYEKECKKAETDGSTPPSNEGVELRSTDELRAELDTQQAKLEMNLNTNPGVVEQYEKRKKEVNRQPPITVSCQMTLLTPDRRTFNYDRT
jgi:chromosome segregation ATPase